jgi:ATP-dependent exoDNAse (exonuclease V) beta subunit
LYRNVLRIPETQALPMQFGTVLHNVMEKVTALHTKEGIFPSDTQVKEYLERELDKMPFTKEEYVRLHEKGYSALLNYIAHIKPVLPKATKEEFSIKVRMETGIPEFPELLLTGKLDRLDLDANGFVTRVIDYKSGKPKTRNEIEGNTKNSAGDYKRQLTFYALLLKLYGDERYVCNTGVLTFVEADAKGVIHEEAFTISDEEVEAHRQELVRVTQEIITGSFLDTPCDPATSSYCHLASMLLRK